MNLHGINDVEHVHRDIFNMLQPDGCFIGAIIGGDTLYELRHSMMLAEQEREGGISPHVFPMTGLKQVGNLLQSIGFSLSTGIIIIILLFKF